MDTTLKIQGMHCNACVSLIKMEIEDIELDSKIKDVRLLEENQGEIDLEEISEEEAETIKNAINNLEQYNVVENDD